MRVKITAESSAEKNQTKVILINGASFAKGLDDWAERIGMTAKEACTDPDCNCIKLKSDNGQQTRFYYKSE